MGDLAARVHAGIGPAGTLHQSFLARERLDRRGQRTLHREATGLDLPAGKRRAVIFDGEFVARHPQPTLAPALTGVPRRNSSEAIGCLPARCTCVSRMAPSPQAMVRRSSSAVPDFPLPSPLVERSALMRALPISNQAPGNGDSPRMWL